MPAPIKHKQQTGDFRAPLISVAVLLALIGIVLYTPGVRFSEKSPTTRSETSAAEPQVQGATTAEKTEKLDSEQAHLADLEEATVKEVVDGDTVKVQIKGDTFTIRLIGIDTPELKDPRKPVQCYAKEASSYTKNTLLGKNVFLEADSSQDNKDKYNRLLRYIYVNGELFNKLTIQNGFAYEYTYDRPYHYQKQFKAAEADAILNKRGLWSTSTCNGQV